MACRRRPPVLSATECEKRGVKDGCTLSPIIRVFTFIYLRQSGNANTVSVIKPLSE